MREAFQEQLGQLGDHLAEMCTVVASAMEKATTALLEHDLPLARDVIAGDATIGHMFTVLMARDWPHGDASTSRLVSGKQCYNTVCHSRARASAH